MKYAGYERLFERVRECAMNVNADFTVPMLEKEVECIVRSVSKWTARHITQGGFDQWGGKWRENSIRVWHTKSGERAIEIKLFKEQHPEMSTRMLAEVFNVSAMTISRVLRESIL